MAALLSRSTFLCKLKPLLSKCRQKELTNHRLALKSYSSAGMQAQVDVLACNIYVSEGHNRGALQAMQDSLNEAPGVHIAHVFVDAPYHRTGFTLTSLNTDQLLAGALALSHTALGLIDLRNHKAKHPRLGALDHISVHHLGSHSLPTRTPSSQPASSAPKGCLTNSQGCLQGPPDLSSHAHQPLTSHQELDGSRLSGDEKSKEASSGPDDLPGCVARALGRALAGPQFGLPVYYYGSAHPQQRRLADVRRGLGYFKGSNAQRTMTPAGSAGAGEASRPGHNSSSRGVDAPEWQGGLPMTHLSHFPPDEGPLELKPQHGVVTIGSGPWVVNYNVPVMLQIAKGSESVRGAVAGGLDGVEGGGEAPGLENRDTSSELLQLAKVLAKGVSERGGGLKLVESMALAHEDGIVEVACNLLGGGEGVAPLDVQVYIEKLAQKLNEGAVKVIVGQGYQTGKSPQQLVQLTMHALACG
ncbi:hypothetical protein DUNSADRAFT_9698 [Dunaliella salina]|uniref:Formiminotransferase N-terminal subdomain domain-containing protein n=1 Tax=Dunaliella salina TaxID=3046 RepID=A0ABQ7GGY4_DUNSA|nr:hypothetical protein DUNSADRAFT_9698 [Dunaliella salina]|eukprot:KAF5833863.1 hypothetical protein DUNSADRAFT_9698 [Dunaliella salina]